MSDSDITDAMDSLSISDPRRVPALPLRPSWLAEEAMNRKRTISEATKDVMDTWNAWADCVEKVFQQMGDQTADLDIAEDEYISFVRMLASHPARPTRQPLEDITEHEVYFMKTMPYRYLTHLHGLWVNYADKVEKTYVSMAAELGRCNLLASPFEPSSTQRQLQGILRSMLGPGRPFHRLADTHFQEVTAFAEMSPQGPSFVRTDEVLNGIANLSIHEESTTQMRMAEELSVRLESMKIDANMSSVDSDL
ncbi:hypothetical protein BDR22DRAFT_54898 [Usnea florida]